MSLAIPVPFTARRSRYRAVELVREADIPLEQELPTAVVVHDIGEERVIRDAWHKCGHQVLKAYQHNGMPNSNDEYLRTQQEIIDRCKRPSSEILRPYEIKDPRIIMAMAQFSLKPPYEHPLVEMDRQLAAVMLKEQQN